jgi:hypothetical protein
MLSILLQRGRAKKLQAKTKISAAHIQLLHASGALADPCTTKHEVLEESIPIV